VKREPTCSALKLFSWYSGISALQDRKDVNGFALKSTLGLRPATEIERQGLDVTEHGEEGYIL
jgi:hypothetical protein